MSTKKRAVSKKRARHFAPAATCAELKPVLTQEALNKLVDEAKVLLGDIEAPAGKVPMPTGEAFSVASAKLAKEQVESNQGQFGNPFLNQLTERQEIMSELLPSSHTFSDYGLNKTKGQATAALQDTFKERALDYAIEKIERFINPFKEIISVLKKEKAAAVVARSLAAVDKIATQVDSKLRIDRQNSRESTSDCFGAPYTTEETFGSFPVINKP